MALVGIGREREKIEITVSFCSYPTRNRKFQKNSKKIQKIKKQHYGFISSQNTFKKAEKERKKKLTVSFCPTRHVIENSRKIAKKFRKLKKYHYDFISSKNRLEKAEKWRKLKLSFRFVPTRSLIENFKKIAKKFKKLKNTIKSSFQAKVGWKRPRRRENKNYRFIPFLSDK